MAAQQAGEAASATLPTYAHTPFPDLTGLRTSAPSRLGKASSGSANDAARNEVDLRTNIRLQDLGALEKEFDVQEGDLVRAAWGAVLLHYMSHETSDMAYTSLVREQSSGAGALSAAAIRLSLDEQQVATINAREFLETVASQSQRHERPADASDDQGGDTAVLFSPQPLANVEGEIFRNGKNWAAVMLAQGSNSGPSSTLSLKLFASPTVHSPGSALLHLEQISTFLSSLITEHKEGKPDALPVLSLERFPEAQRAADNAHPPALEKGAGPGGIKEERFESQFERNAIERPDEIALDFRFSVGDGIGQDVPSNVRWTYAELDHRATLLRNEIWARGVGSVAHEHGDGGDQIVALCLEKSPETYLAILAVLKAGAAWCPIDTDWPSARRSALLSKSRAKIVLAAGDAVCAGLDEVLPEYMQVVRMDAMSYDRKPDEPSTAHHKRRSPDELAYMIWTSGTTGLPKGVGIQHKSGVQALRALQDVIPHGDAVTSDGKMRYLQFSAYNFDLMIMDCFYAWGLGGTICSCPRGILLGDLVRVATSFQATHTLLTPAVMAMTPREAIPSLRVVINGGEKLSQVVADEWSKDCCLLNLYGPAEATLIAMNRRVPLGDEVKAPNIGVALPTCSCHALDKKDDIVLKGAVGELVLGGHQLAREYMREPEKTADKFFQHPQLGRVYRTGDLVRQLWNGDFEYLGRADDQVKINGIRIELLEINAAIKNSHESVKDSETMALPRPGNEVDMQIVNFSVVPSAEAQSLICTDEQAVEVVRKLRRSAEENLPTYMVPSLFVVVTHFPRTSSAKIDRVAIKNALKELDVLEWENAIANDGSDVTGDEESEEEQRMRHWLSILCGVQPEKIGRRTPFPSVGLDSIKAMTFSAKLAEEGIVVSVVDVISYPTLAGLSAHFKAAGAQESRSGKAQAYLQDFDARYRPAVLAALGVDSSNISAVLPPSPLQEGMLAETQHAPSAYWVHRHYALSEKVDLQQAKTALQKVVDQIECLRTCFCDIGQLDVGTNTTQSSTFSPTFLQAVRTRVSAKVNEVTVVPSEDFEASVIAHADKKVERNPLNGNPPAAFLVVRQDNQTSLVLVAHHSIHDGQSLRIIEQSIEAAFNEQEFPAATGFARALPYILPLNEQEEQERLKCWDNALESYPRFQELSFPNLSGKALSRSSSNAFKHHTKNATMSWAQLEAASRDMGTSARPIAQVAWGRVLAAYLETDSILLGDSVSGRNISPELAKVAGPVLTTLAVPIQFRQEQTLRQMVDALDDFHRAILQHQHVPLRYIRQLLKLPQGQPLFQSIFVFEPAEDETAQGARGKLTLSRRGDLGISVEHPVALEMQPGRDGEIAITLTWQEALVSEQQGRLLLDQFDAVLSTICKQPDASTLLLDSQYLASEQLLSISRDVASPTIEATKQVPVSTWVSRWAQDAPQTIALEVASDISGTEPTTRRLSYAELDQASNRVANFLAESIPPKSIVAVCLPRTAETYIYLLGILKSGHAYLPVDETLPAQRKRVLIEDSQAAYIIASSSTAEQFGQHAMLYNIDSQEHQSSIGDRSPSQPQTQIAPSDLAYVLYTSGSTGTPKGCLLTHENFWTAIEAFRLVFEREAPGSFNGARFLARSAEAFDVHLLETFLPLQVGATIVTAPREVILQDLRYAMHTLQVTHACVVPSLFHSHGERIKPEDLPSIRALIVGGEKITKDIVEAWGAASVPVLNAYGPTEATIGISIARVRPDSITGNIGRPFDGSKFFIMAEKGGKLVPTLRGEPGELCIGGPQVARGYLNRPDLTAFQTWQGQWIYRTGDAARLNVADEAEYLGRIDGSQVKVRGARLELGEVDSALINLAKPSSQLRASTILTDHPERAHSLLVAFISKHARSVREETGAPQLDDSASEFAKGLLKSVRATLPHYMTPSLLVPVTFIPLASVSGKVDVNTLRAVYKGQTMASLQTLNADAEDARELNSQEATVAKVVQELLGDAAQIYPTSDLFGLGLDSLSVISLASRLKRLGMHITSPAIMAEPTVAAIAAASSTQSAKEDGSGAANFAVTVKELTARAKADAVAPSSAIEEVLPCLPLQASLVAQSLSSTSSLYVNAMLLELNDGIDLEKLRSAWQEAVASHAIYRTTFSEVEGEIRQVVLRADACPLQWESVRQPASFASALSSYQAEVATAIARQINRLPPIRFRLWTGSTKSNLSIDVHHALYDGVSLSNVLNEVEQRIKGNIVSKTSSYREVVKHIYTTSDEEAGHFWTNAFEDFTVTPFPNLSGRRVKTTQAVTLNDQTITSRHSLSELRSRARSQGVTLQTLALSAFSKLFAAYTGEDDVTFGLVLSGRTLPLDNVEGIQGPCLTTVPFRFRADSAKSSAELLKTTQKAYAAVLPHQHTSLPAISRWLGVEQNLFDTLFSYLPKAKAATTLWEQKSSSMETGYPLAIEVQSDDDLNKMQLRAAYRDDLVPREHADLLLQQLDAVLGELAGLDYPRADLKYKSAGSLYSVLNADQQALDDTSLSFVARFKGQVATQPDAVAVVFAPSFDGAPFERVSYRELDDLSDKIAFSFSKLEHEIVGVHLPKSVKLYATILAVWKAGKAYLPLDPALPFERLEYMLSVVRDAPVVTTLDGKATIERLRSTAIDIDDALHSKPGSLPEPSLELPAYILFTSGSTGKPKGVQVSQRALAGAIISWEQMLPWSRSSRMLQLASSGFDVAVFEITFPLSMGFSIASAPKDVLLEDLEDTFNKLDLTIADLPAALASTVHRENIGELEWLMSGGDAIEERVLQEWGSCGRLVNAYGPTEGTIGNTLGFVSPDSSRSVVGNAYTTSAMYVLEPNGVEPTFTGCIGELVVGGPQVADGYFGREDLTKERFINLKDGSRVYRTGDRGRILANGLVECLGRTEKGQVKVNGQRVELDEISHTFKSQATVHDADTQYLKHPSFQSKQLVAFLSLDDGAASATLALRDDEEMAKVLNAAVANASKHLATYMIPAQLLVLKGRLPLTPNNKVDHKLLEKFYCSLDSKVIRNLGAQLQQAENDAEWSPEEEKLRAVLSRFCKIPEADISRKISFYRLGIDSISAIRLVREFRAAGFEVAVKDVMRSPSIAALAANLEDARHNPQAMQLAARQLQDEIRRRTPVEEWLLSKDDEILSVLPATPLQSGMISQTLASEGRLYAHHHVFRMEIKTSLEPVWKEVVQRNDILRTTFHTVDEEFPWVQSVHKAVSPSFAEHDVETAERLQSSIAQLMDTYPLSDEAAFGRPPHAVNIFRSPTETQVVFSLHHALYDGFSLPQLFAEIQGFGGETLSRPSFSSLTPHLLPDSTNTEYWTRQLEDYQPSLLSQGCELGSATRAERRLDLDVSEAERICRELGVSVQVMANLAFAKLLAAMTESGDVVFGQVFGLRDAFDGADRILGPALNTVPTRISFDDDKRSVADQVRLLQGHNDAGRPHRRAALRDVQSALYKRGVRSALFDALFDFQKDVDDGASQDTTLVPVETDESTVAAQYAFNVEFVQRDGSLSLMATADQSMFPPNKLSSLLTRLERIFTHLLRATTEPAVSMPDGESALRVYVPKVKAHGNGHTQNADHDDVQELTAHERTLRRIVAQAAQVEQEDIESSTTLASLGLDSISAIRIAASARKQGLQVGVADVIQGSTIRGIASRIKAKADPSARKTDTPILSAQAKEQAIRALGLKAQEVEHVLPLLPGQIFSLSTWLNSGRQFGVFSWSYRSNSKLDGAKLEAAWRALRQKHAILRTTFVCDNDEPLQVTLNDDAFPSSWTHKTVRGNLDEAAKSILRKAAARNNDCSVPPASAFHLESEDGDVVILNLHHALYDAWSIPLLVSDLGALYQGRSSEASPDFHGLVNHVHQARDSTATKDYWTKALSGASPSMFPSIRQSPAPSTAQDTFVFVTGVLRNVSSAEKKLRSTAVNLQTLFLAAWSSMSSRTIGADSPVFGLYQVGRSASFPDIERVAGPCMTILPVMLRSARTRSLIELAEEAQTALRDRTAFEQSSLAEIQSWLGRPLDSPLFNTYINLLWLGAETAEEPDTLLRHVKLGEPTDFAPAQPFTGPTKVDGLEQRKAVRADLNIDIALDPKADSVNVGLRCHADIMDENQARELASKLGATVSEALASL